jgi:hypothetical protein
MRDKTGSCRLTGLFDLTLALQIGFFDVSFLFAADEE